MNTIQKLRNLAAFCDQVIEMARGDQMLKIVRDSGARLPKASAIDTPLRYSGKARDVSGGLKNLRGMKRVRKSLYDAYEAAERNGSDYLANEAASAWERSAKNAQGEANRVASLIVRPKRSN